VRQDSRHNLQPMDCSEMFDFLPPGSAASIVCLLAGAILRMTLPVKTEGKSHGPYHNTAAHSEINASEEDRKTRTAKCRHGNKQQGVKSDNIIRPIPIAAVLSHGSRV
jgi:hypothetical protein